MLAYTAETGALEYNTVDGTLWFVHAVGRHVERTGDVDLAAELFPDLRSIVEHHVTGTRYGIGVDPADGLLRRGEPGVALTWMDARVDGIPVTPRAGKPVEINALWINALGTIAALAERTSDEAAPFRRLHERAVASFRARFVAGDRVFDVVDGLTGDDGAMRPNQRFALSLPHAPLDDRRIVERCARELLTPLGLRSLARDGVSYRGRHRGDPAARDQAYHQGTVWPWLIGPFAAAAYRVGLPLEGLLLEALERHVAEDGLGSVSETADGDAPHHTTGCPFQAWSVAELIRARALAAR